MFFKRIRNDRFIFFLFIFVASILLLIQIVKPIIKAEITNRIVFFSTPLVNFCGTPIIMTTKMLNYLSTSFNSYDDLINSKNEYDILLQEFVKQKIKLDKLENYKNIVDNIDDQFNKISDAKILSIFVNQSKYAIIKTNSIVKNNDIVINDKGFIGLVNFYDPNNSYAKVYLLTDTKTKIPVMSSKSNVYGIIEYIGKTNCEFIFSYAKSDVSLIEKNEIIITSGEEGLTPRGIKIGIVVNRTKNEVCIKSLVDFDNLDTLVIISNE